MLEFTNMNHLILREYILKQRNRKLLGLFLMLGLLIIYSAFAVMVYEKMLADAPDWVLIIYFAIAGFGWAIPAGVLIKWMAKPD